MQTIFENGESIDLGQILMNKDWRANLQHQLMTKYPNQTIVGIKLNVPGSIKQSPALKQMFTAGFTDLMKGFGQSIVDQYAYVNRATGAEAFLVIDQNLRTTKTQAIKFEQEHQLGRLFDVDVMNQGEDGRQLSRTELGFDTRRCFVCGEDAKACARAQKHSKAEITDALNQLYENFMNDENGK